MDELDTMPPLRASGKEDQTVQYLLGGKLTSILHARYAPNAGRQGLAFRARLE
jgi:hypothetical protein